MEFFQDLDTSSDDYSNDSATDKSALIPTGSKTYGTHRNSSLIAIEDRLTYTWKEIDVYGEQPTDGSGAARAWKKVKNCFTGNGRKEIIPRKQLLKNITGVAHAGELLAVLGSSGAGKTTLLNALAFRSPPGIKVSATSIRALNGCPIRKPEQLRSKCAYVVSFQFNISSFNIQIVIFF